MPTVHTRIAPAHWVRPNETTRVPRRHICLDVEAGQVDMGDHRVQTFRLAVASFDGQDRAGRPWYQTRWGHFTDPADLWQWVDDRTAAGRRTILVAHNLGYDLRVGRALEYLPALGWTLDMIRLDDRQSWAKWHRGDRGLTMVDSTSWFGAKLEQVAPLVDAVKLPLPDFADDDGRWLARCRRDVEILREAWLRTVSWVEAEDMGNWKPTGAGQGWAYFRHAHMTHRILHHAQPEIAAVEREAGWTGRCEAWRWGDLGAGPWWEVDYSAAYTRVALDCAVPVKLIGRVSPSEAGRYLRGVEGRAALLRCDVNQTVPTAPTRGPDGILWPVGRFQSWLWDIEARQVVADGGQVRIREAFIYRSEPALRQWAGWVLDQLARDPTDLDPLVRLVIKGWGRSVVGRFAARWGAWNEYGEAHGPDVALSTLIDGDTGARNRMLTLGARSFVEGEPTDAPDSAVHVMSWIMAECRCRLLAAMRRCGIEHLAYVDTDGLIVDDVGRHRLTDGSLPGLRVKSGWRHVEVLGPRQLVVDGKLRMAGVPSKAKRVGERTWAGEVWSTLPGSLSAGEAGSVRISDRTWVVKGLDTRRAHLPGGRTAAIEVDQL